MPDAFRFLLAPDLEAAFGALAREMDAAPLPPATCETILIPQASGLRAWFEQRLARHTGCAAALDVRTPRGLVGTLTQLLVAEARALPDDEAHPFDLEPLTWRLADVLADVLADALADAPDDPALAPLHAYLGRQPDGAPALAGVLARRFDDYQLYRPETLEAWRAGRTVHASWPHEAWQRALWQRLCQSARTADGQPVADHARTLLQLVGRLEQGRLPEHLRARLPARVSAFGARALPPAFYRVLRGLAHSVPVTVYAVAPGLRAEAFRDEAAADVRHPLLRACSEHQRAFASVLRALRVPAPEALPPTEQATGARATGLARLQAALRADAPPAAPAPLAPDDASLRVIDAHSPVRELEALRDELLAAFHETPDLRPHDVLVIVPDLALYAPLVDAVFGAEALPGNVRVPYHVADHPHAPPLRVLEAFTAALRLPDGRLGTTDVLDLLDYPAVARAAGLREDDVPRLRGWIAEAGVRWGRSATDRVAHGLPADALHTWQFGLERLVLGYALGRADPVLGCLPCDAPGLGGADVLGRFAEWLHRLLRRLDALARPRPLGEWPEALLAFADAFFAPRDDDETDALVFLRTAIAAVAELARPDADAPVSLRAVGAYLERTLRTYDAAEPYLTGAVTFAAPFPLHHTPHRVVAFLGLDAATYPGRETAPTFCLLAHAPRPGDPAAREAAKQLFLDAVMAAGERLILSFVGRSQKDNTERAASVVLDAFLDACDAHFGPEARARIVRRHRLQPFAPAYFGAPADEDDEDAPGGDGHAAAPALFSYAEHLLPPREARLPAPFVRLRPHPPETPPERVDLHTLARAWSDPAGHWTRHVLGLRLEPAERALVADEPVVPDDRERFGLRSAVLEALLSGAPPEATRERLRLAGLLPAGALGQIAFEQALAEAAPLASAAEELGPSAPVPVALTAEQTLVHGTLARVTETGALRLHPGTIRPGHLAEAWVEHVALNAAADLDGRLPRITRVLGTKDSAHLRPICEGEASLWLAALVRGFGCFQSAPPPLFPAASHAYMDELRKRGQVGALALWLLERERARQGGDEVPGFNPELDARALQQAHGRLEGGFGQRGDLETAHAMLVARDASPLEDERAFVRWSAALWAPLLLHCAPAS
ncbi:MAG: exodeoxyribonuclease V subunit gamma [Rubricoccaceae bacterium]